MLTKTRKNDLVSDAFVPGFNVSSEVPYTRIVNEVMACMTVVSRTVPDQDIIEKVALVRAYAEFALDHPDVLAFHRCLVASLDRLADALELRGAAELSKRTRSILSSRAGADRFKSAHSGR